MKSAIIAASCALALGGCASVVRGTTDQVVITSDPADATIRTSLGHWCPRSPCTVRVSRSTEFTAFATKEGYKPGQVFIGTAMSAGGAAGLAGNILMGGMMGARVDAATGATMNHFPNPAHIRLVPIDSPGESTNLRKPAAIRPQGAPTS